MENSSRFSKYAERVDWCREKSVLLPKEGFRYLRISPRTSALLIKTEQNIQKDRQLGGPPSNLDKLRFMRPARTSASLNTLTCWNRKDRIIWLLRGISDDQWSARQTSYRYINIKTKRITGRTNGGFWPWPHIRQFNVWGANLFSDEQALQRPESEQISLCMLVVLQTL